MRRRGFYSQVRDLLTYQKLDIECMEIGSILGLMRLKELMSNFIEIPSIIWHICKDNAILQLKFKKHDTLFIVLLKIIKRIFNG